MARYAYHRLDSNHREIVDGLEAVGVSVTTICPGDALCGFRGVNFLLEIKTARGKLRPSQERFKARWRGQYAVVRTLDEALSVIGAR